MQERGFGSETFERVRRKGWENWWKQHGVTALPQQFRRRSFCEPKFDAHLAEFVGIMIGDGSITKRQIMVYLGSESDEEYIGYVAKTMCKILGTVPTVRKLKSKCVAITISRTEICDFCIRIGLKQGDKIRNKLDIPGWILENNEFSIACVRGIMDTDGCIFAEKHSYKDKKYQYPRLAIVSHSPELRESLCIILKKLQFSPKIRNNRSVNLEKRSDIIRYFNVIGTSNPKHLRRLNGILERCVSG